MSVVQHACAIYTRKSSEEGLEQAFNTLDAQREACVSYIQSQKHEGWKALPDLYDDGGFSGGSMERPALKRLMNDIKTGKVKTIVVYKVDRLTRSLADFAKLVELFDQHGVTFVSVTQQFNTTTSMGRLTLNVLLSFAQFEREVAGERIRDKIAASKRRGMWMGGALPLGYEVRERKLVIVPIQAEQVRRIFDLYRKLKNVSDLHDALKNDKIVNRDVARGALYTMLKNPIYIGKIHHKGSLYDGEHEAILPDDIWQQVQDVLGNNRVSRASQIQKTDLLLTGRIFDEQGERLTPTTTLKKGKRYSYYVSHASVRGRPKKTAIRLPAGAIDALITKELAANRFESQLIDRVVVSKSRLRVYIKGREEPINIEYHIAETGPFRQIASHAGSDTSNEAQKKVLKNLIIKAMTWRDRLFNEPGMTVKKLATEIGIDDSYVMKLITCSFISPQIASDILKGHVPSVLTRKKLVAGVLPYSWSEQAAAIGCA